MTLRFAPLFFVLAGSVGAQHVPVPRLVPSSVEWLADTPPDAAALAASPEAFAPLLEKNGLALDVKARTLAVRGSTLHDMESLGGTPVEYLVVTERGRTHEALFLVKAQPSLVDACLRALGLPLGSPMRYVSKEPPPSAAELEAGAEPWVLVAPSGQLVDVEVAWTGADGAPHRIPLESALLDVRTGKALPDLDWVYTGGGYGPLREGRRVMQTFLGDVQGDLIGVCTLDRGGEGACVLERNSAEGVDDTLYEINTELAPPRGTPVTLLLHPTDKASAAVPTPQPEVVVAGELGQKLDAWLERAAGFGFSGVVLAERDGAVALHKGYGLADREQGTPLTTATVFPLGGLGRQFTVAAALQLVANKQLKLEDPIDLHVDKVPEDKIPITVGMLMAHASGLPASLAPSPEPEGNTLGADRRATVTRILATPLAEAPGTPGVGGPLDDALLAAVVESAADDIWRGYVGEHLFAPAGMTSAGLLGEPRWPSDRLAHGYAGPPGARQALPLPYDEPLSWLGLGAGAAASSVRDVHRWLTALSGGAILPPPQLEAFFGPGAAAWRVTDTPHGRLAAADGTTPGFHVEVRRWLDNNTTLIVAGNSEDVGIAAPLCEILFGADVPAAPSVEARTEAATAALVGDWRSDGFALRVSASREDGSGLWITPLDQATLDLLDGASIEDRALRTKFGVRTVALLVSIANGRWDEAASTLGPGVTASGCEATLGPWWNSLGAGLGKPVSPAVIAVGNEDGALAVDIEMRFEQGVARRRVLWRDGALADMRLPGAALGVRRVLPELGNPVRYDTWDPVRGAGPWLRQGQQADTATLSSKWPGGAWEIVLRRSP